MLRLSSEITIEGEKTWVFKFLAGCNVVQDTGTLTDTCTLELPKKIKWEGFIVKNGKLPIKRGDRITIKLGYDNDLTFKFSGFIRTVDAKNPVKIHCEDGMFLLKTHKAPSKSYKNAMLKDVITDMLEGTNIDFQLIDDDIKLGKYRITQPTVAQALQELKERHMLQAYFRTINDKSILYVGLAYPFDNRKKEKFVHGKNIINEDFEYRDKEEIRAKVEATSFGAKHKKTYLEVGDKDGDVIKIRIDGLTELELKKYAENTLDKYKQTGFKGTFEAFGEPIVASAIWSKFMQAMAIAELI